MSESLCLWRLINHPPKLTFSSPVGAQVVAHGPYIPFIFENLFIIYILISVSWHKNDELLRGGKNACEYGQTKRT